MSLKMGPLMVSEYRKEWESAMERRYGAGNCPSSGPDCFEAWLSNQIYSLQGSLAFVKGQQEKAKQEAHEYKKQRNLALILCAVFLALALFLAFRPRKDTAPAQAAVSQSVSTTETFSEWTARRNRNYVASINSDKYHCSTEEIE